MANKTSTLLNLALALSLVALFFITIAESRPFFGAGGETLSCDSVVGVAEGDTCFDIAKSNNMTTKDFLTVNPNLNCSALFIGQWLCVEGIFA